MCTFMQTNITFGKHLILLTLKNWQMLEFNSHSNQTPQSDTKAPYTAEEDEIILKCVRESSSISEGLRLAATQLKRGITALQTRYYRDLKHQGSSSHKTSHRGSGRISAPSGQLSLADSSSLQMATLSKIVDKFSPQIKQSLIHYILNL